MTAESEPSSARTARVTVPDDALGMRLDVFLAQIFPDRSRSRIQKLIREAQIKLNELRCTPRTPVTPGDVVDLVWPREPRSRIVPMEMELDILAEDDAMLVINKPPRLVVHPTTGHRTGTLVHALLHHDPRFGEMIDGQQRPGIVHRLDKDTSGAMVVAKTDEAWCRLKAAFKERDVEKVYLAILVGEFGSLSGRVDAPIGRHPVNRTKMAVVPEGGKPSVSLYRVLGSHEGLTLLEVRILTGRTHQIRVHFAHLRHPVLADSLYGGRQRDLPVMPSRQMLHAWKLVFPHPVTGIKREYMAPPPEDFRETLRLAGLPEIRGDKSRADIVE